MRQRESLPSARRAIALVFVIHGFVFASWTAHIPHVKAALGLSDHQLGLALLGAPVGSVVAALMLIWLLPRSGARRVLPIALAGYAVGGALVGLVSSSVELFGALAIWGFFQGSLDATMNTEAVAIEESIGRSVLSGLHGLWSAGSLVGAALGTVCVAAGIGVAPQLAVNAVVVLLSMPALSARLTAPLSVRGVAPPNPECGIDTEPPPSPAPPGARPSRKRMSQISVAVVILGVVCTASLLCEGAVADWSAVYLHDDLRTSAIVSGLGYALFMGGMLLIRLVGDRVRDRVGSKRSVTTLAGLATVGMAIALMVAGPAATVGGFFFLGIGLGLVFPTAVTAAGRIPGVDTGVAVSVVSASGWVGYVAGPPLIGQLASAAGLRRALGIIPLLTMVITAIAGLTAVMRIRDR